MLREVEELEAVALTEEVEAKRSCAARGGREMGTRWAR